MSSITFSVTEATIPHIACFSWTPSHPCFYHNDYRFPGLLISLRHPNPPALLLTPCYCPIFSRVTSHLIAEKSYWSCFQTSCLQSIFPAAATSRYNSDPVTLLIQSLPRFPRGCEIMSEHLQSAHRASRKGAPHSAQLHRTTGTSPSSFTALHS